MPEQVLKGVIQFCGYPLELTAYQFDGWYGAKQKWVGEGPTGDAEVTQADLDAFEVEYLKLIDDAVALFGVPPKRGPFDHTHYVEKFLRPRYAHDQGHDDK